MRTISPFKLSLAALSVVALSTPVFAEEPLDKASMTQAQKYSYLQGYSLAKRLRDGKVELDADSFAHAIRDGLKGDASLFNDDESQAIITAQQQIETDKQQAASATNIEKGKAFLEENAQKEGVKTLLSGVQYRVLETGDPEGKKPGKSDTVVVHYEGRRIDGQVFDSSFKRGQPASFKVAGVVKGFSDALQNMRPGDKWEVYIPSKLGYGARKVGQYIRPHETLIFKLELIEIK